MSDTTSRRLGLTPAERNALIVLSGLEAYRGGAGRDIAAVAANVINRRLSGQYPVNILNIAKQPSQYAAVDRYTMQQLSDPTFGRKVLGKEYDKVAAVIENPALIAQEIKNLRGATQFRGQSLLKNKKPGDYMADPLGNFYFNFNPAIAQKGLKLFGAPTAAPSAPPAQAPAPRQGGVSLPPFDIKNAIKKLLLKSSIEGMAAPTMTANAISLQQKASELRNQGADDEADIVDSQIVSSLMADTQKETGLDPTNLVKGLLEIKLQQRDYNRMASAIESSTQDLATGQTAQNLGTNAATGAKPGQGIAFPGAVVTSAKDVTGEPGLDFALAGGRGAMFASPFRAQVLKVVRESNPANRGPGGRGYGNYVELRGVTPEGQQFDALVAHFDQLNPNLKPGMVIEPGTRIGTQGETGRATGPHISMDFYEPGKTTASSDILRIRDVVASRIQKGLPPFG